MPKRNASEHSTSYAESYADETVSDSKQSNFALDHPPDDWRQTDFAHRFKDELKAINDSAAANFDNTKKLTEYTGDERKQLAYATAEAFRSMDFESVAGLAAEEKSRGYQPPGVHRPGQRHGAGDAAPVHRLCGDGAGPGPGADAGGA